MYILCIGILESPENFLLLLKLEDEIDDNPASIK